MNNVDKELPKALTIEELKNRVGKPVFVAGLIYGAKNWRVVKGFGGANTIEFTDKSWIAKEFQDKFRFFDTEVSGMELKEILDVEEKEKNKTGYERVGKGESYYTINIFKEVVSFTDDEFSEIYTETSYFNDENLVENIARAERLKYQLRRYAALNGGIPSPVDWQNIEIEKYFIDYLYHIKSIKSGVTRLYRGFGQIYFKNEEACKKAMVIFKDELIWYFTEFEEQLY